MKCVDVYRHVCEELDARLGSRKCRAIRAHLSTCPDCAAYLSSLKRTVVLARALPAPPLPAAVHWRLMRTLERRGCTGASPRRIRRT